MHRQQAPDKPAENTLPHNIMNKTLGVPLLKELKKAQQKYRVQEGLLPKARSQKGIPTMSGYENRSISTYFLMVQIIPW